MDNRSIPSLMLFCGVGGVGKTSISAAMAYLAACKGKDSVAFTVDPARRLADTLGLETLEDQLSEIRIDTDNDNSHGRFRASMLNLDTVAEELVKLYSPTRHIADTIISNPVFHTAVNHMSNTEEYLAWGKVYQLLTCVSMDTLFVDTAPAASALNFFDAPRQLLNLINPKHIRLVKNPVKRFILAKQTQKKGTLALIESVLSGIVGKKWLDDAVQLLVYLANLYDDFFDRVNHLQKILHDPEQTSIILVTAPNDSCLEETCHLASSLLGSNLPLKAVVFNRTAPPLFPADNLNDISQTNQTNCSDNTCEEIRRFIKNYRLKVANETQLMMHFLKSLPREINSYRIPLLSSEITSLADLKQMHPYCMDSVEYF
jgi:anion-transporting  ArsA/GET3 family ATPase